jgi:hypothetical protein
MKASHQICTNPLGLQQHDASHHEGNSKFRAHQNLHSLLPPPIQITDAGKLTNTIYKYPVEQKAWTDWLFLRLIHLEQGGAYIRIIRCKLSFAA